MNIFQAANEAKGESSASSVFLLIKKLYLYRVEVVVWKGLGLSYNYAAQRIYGTWMSKLAFHKAQ